MEDTLTLDGLPARGADEQEEREAEQLLRANPTPPVLVNVRHPRLEPLVTWSLCCLLSSAGSAIAASVEHAAWRGWR